MSCYQLPGNMIGESCVICAIRQEPRVVVTAQVFNAMPPWRRRSTLSTGNYGVGSAWSMQCHQVFDEMSSICDEMLFNLELRKCLLQLLTIGVG
jgi:hypothetical protein